MSLYALRTVRRLRKAVERVAAENPNVRLEPDAQCLYFYEPDGEIDYDAPCCIVGYAMRSIGWVPDLSDPDDNLNNRIFTTVSSTMLKVSAANKDVQFIRTVQRFQDRGYSWSDSVTQAWKGVPK